ncbi:hypothetical protein [Streptomyces melanogenes]|uniref:hypothetical protein n=1 Tax=Streptomyces melanogenes TaxID=67326 RepID=UPI003796E470
MKGTFTASAITTALAANGPAHDGTTWDKTVMAQSLAQAGATHRTPDSPSVSKPGSESLAAARRL